MKEVIMKMDEVIMKIDNETVKAWGPVLVGMLSLLFAYWTNRRLLNAKTKEEERTEINKKLSEFYGPFTQLSHKSLMIYRLFTKDKKRHYQTLSELLNGTQFSGNDKVLLEQIILINKQLEELIINKSGYVEDFELRQLLAKAATHFNVMKLAFDGTIKGEKDRFEEYLYPRELSDKINEDIDKLNRRLKELK